MFKWLKIKLQAKCGYLTAHHIGPWSLWVQYLSENGVLHQQQRCEKCGYVDDRMVSIAGGNAPYRGEQNVASNS